MAMAKETGLQARDTNTAAPSSQPQTTPTTLSESTIRQRYPPLTTQFSERDVCRFLFSKDRQSVFPDGVTVTYSTSDRYNDDFSSCQPSGWTTSYFQFSPGMCPSGWGYNEMRTVEPGVSQAYCCAEGYFYYTELTECGSMAKYGPGTTAETRTTTDTRGQVHTETAKTVYLHRAWNVKWEASDTANLPVSLPELTSGIVIQSWEPSTTHSSGGNNGGYYKGPKNPNNVAIDKGGGGGLSTGNIALAVLLPCLIVIGIAVCGFVCWKNRRGLRTHPHPSEAVALDRVLTRRAMMASADEHEQRAEQEQQQQQVQGEGDGRRRPMSRYF